MTDPRIDLVFDASVWVDVLDGGAIADLVQSVQIMNTIGTPHVVLGQLAEFYGRRMPEKWDAVREAVTSTSVLLPLTSAVAVEAGRMRAAAENADRRFTLADAMALATARAHRAELLTRDPAFKGLAGVRYFGGNDVVPDQPRSGKPPRAKTDAPLGERLKRLARSNLPTKGSRR